MIGRAWPRLAEVLPAIPPEARADLARALELPMADPGGQYLMDLLTDGRAIRRQIRAVPERAAQCLARFIKEKGGPSGSNWAGLSALARAGVVLPTPAGMVFPLEFAFAADELLPEESLLRLIARGRVEDLHQWLEGLLALLGLPAPARQPSLLLRAADLYALLTAEAETLVAGLDVTARTAIERFGPMDGLLGRRKFMEEFEPNIQAREGVLLPFKIPSECSSVVRSLFLRGLLAPSGSAWQPGVYLHIPIEMRPAALARYRERQEAERLAIIAAAEKEDYRPSPNRLSVDGPALLCQTTGVIASFALRLSQQGRPLQSDLERAGKIVGVPGRQMEALVNLALSLGLAGIEGEKLAVKAQDGWPMGPFTPRPALAGLTVGRSLPAGPDQDFVALLRLAVLEGLNLTEAWVTARHLLDLVLNQPGLGRWLEYFWGMDAPAQSLAVAIADALEALAHLGAVELEPAGEDGFRAARALPWGRALLGTDLILTWPSPGPLVVTPSHEVYAPLGLGPAVLARLGRYADLAAAGPTMVFKLSRDSLWRGASAGVDLKQEMDWLARLTGGELPQNVRENLGEMAARQGEVQVGSASVFVRVKDPGLLATIKCLPGVDKQVVAETGDLVVLAPGVDPGQLARDLRRAGLLVEEQSHQTALPRAAARKKKRH